MGKKTIQGDVVITKTLETSSTAVGLNLEVGESGNTAVGQYSVATAPDSSAIGLGATAINGCNKVAIGNANKDYADALFEVGNGNFDPTTDYDTANAFTVFNDGHAEVQSSGTTDSSIVRRADLTPVIELAEGKTKTYIVQANPTGGATEDASLLGTADNPKADISFTSTLENQGTSAEPKMVNVITVGKGKIIVDTLKLGDIVLIKDLNYPDRWVSDIKSNGSSYTVTLSALETPKIDLTTSAITLTEVLWTDKTIGHIAGTTTKPVAAGNIGDSLDKVLKAMFGNVVDDTADLVTKPTIKINSIYVPDSDYEYGTKVSSVTVNLSSNAGSYKYGPTVTGGAFSGNYTLSGTGFTTKNNSSSSSQAVSLSSTFTVGKSNSITLSASRAYNAATNTAESKLGGTTTQSYTSGTATDSKTFNPTANFYQYFAVTSGSSTTAPTSGTKLTEKIKDYTTTAAERVWFLDTASGKKIWQNVAGDWNDVTAGSKSVTFTLASGETYAYTAYYTDTLASGKSFTFKLTTNKND